MLIAIEGYYDKGEIVLNEDPCIDIKTDVIVTFLQEETNLPIKRRLGLLEGKITIPEDFNDPIEDLKHYM